MRRSRWRTDSASTSSPQGRCSIVASHGPSSAISGGLDDLRESIERLKGASALLVGYRPPEPRRRDLDRRSAPSKDSSYTVRRRRSASRAGCERSFWWSKSESTWMLFDLGRWDELLATVDEVVGSAGETRRIAGARARTSRIRHSSSPDAETRTRAALIAEDVLPKGAGIRRPAAARARARRRRARGVCERRQRQRARPRARAGRRLARPFRSSSCACSSLS